MLFEHCKLKMLKALICLTVMTKSNFIHGKNDEEFCNLKLDEFDMEKIFQNQDNKRVEDQQSTITNDLDSNNKVSLIKIQIFS